MARYAAFLRGVNLGRNRKISSADLRKHFGAMGFEDVGTFRTSGNVVFGGARGTEAKLQARVEKELSAAVGFDVTVFLRSEDEVRAIADHQPFAPADVESSEGKLQVSILAGKPAAAARKQVLALATDQDQLVFGERELYWLPSGGILESPLDLKAIEKLVGPSTRRTKGTMELLAEKFFGLG
jgi:uncharacterized protein (DUF1697 family)